MCYQETSHSSVDERVGPSEEHQFEVTNNNIEESSSESLFEGDELTSSPTKQSKQVREGEGEANDDIFETLKTKILRTTKEYLTLSKPTTTLFLLTILWYSSSVLCTNTSKSLNLPWEVLTFTQLGISSACAVLAIYLFNLNDGVLLPFNDVNEASFFSTFLLSAASVLGFVTLNSSLRRMDMATVMILRSVEPVVTLILCRVLLPSEKMNVKSVVALCPIMMGAVLVATGLYKVGHVPTMMTMMMGGGASTVFVCNGFFSLRTILTKRLKKKYPIDDFNLFFRVCVLGFLLQGALILLSRLDSEKKVDTVTVISEAPPMILFLNGFAFYLYLQTSWIMISRVDAVTHSVCNALRRPIVCAVGWLLFGGGTVQGLLGVVCAVVGVVFYANLDQSVLCQNARERNTQRSEVDCNI